MHKIRLQTLFFILIFSPCLLYSTGQLGRNYVRINVGYARLDMDTDLYDTGLSPNRSKAVVDAKQLGIGVSGRYRLIEQSGFGLDGTLGYSFRRNSKVMLNTDWGSLEVSPEFYTNNFSAGINPYFNLSDIIKPYGRLDIGVIYEAYDSSSFVDDEFDFNWSFGGGVEFIPVENLSLILGYDRSHSDSEGLNIFTIGTSYWLNNNIGLILSGSWTTMKDLNDSGYYYNYDTRRNEYYSVNASPRVFSLTGGVGYTF
jgi:opacity protein-like surface antigen